MLSQHLMLLSSLGQYPLYEVPLYCWQEVVAIHIPSLPVHFPLSAEKQKEQ